MKDINNNEKKTKSDRGLMEEIKSHVWILKFYIPKHLYVGSFQVSSINYIEFYSQAFGCPNQYKLRLNNQFQETKDCGRIR